MSDKSPKKNGQKTAAAKSLKEKRLDKRTKAESKSRIDPISDIKRH
jgi:hypothetical protein